MKYWGFILLSCLLFNSNNTLAQPAGYGFGKQVTVLSTQVAGGTPLINFPMLISITDPDLRTTANGGQVESGNGFDIIFTLGDCSTQLAHDLEHYDPTTGELVIWVQVPLLDNLADTYVYMFYGNSAVATDQSNSAIWTTANYDGVWHLHNDFLDASVGTNNGTNNGSTDISPAYNFGDGQNFTDPNHWIELPNHPNRTGDFTYTGWARTISNNVAGQRVVCDDASNANGCHAISIGDPGAGSIRFYIRGLNPVSLDSPGGIIINDVWHYVAATFNDATNLKSLYVDGVLVGSATVTGTLGTATGNASIGGEVAAGEAGNRFNGSLDEIRSNSSVLSAGWILTEFNNQNSPGTFYGISAQFTAVDLCLILPLPVELLSFKATLTSENTVELDWITKSESNNDYFTLQHSGDGVKWQTLSKIDGAGNSSSPIYYVHEHQAPLLGINYYRLKQTDFNGDYSYSSIQSVSLTSLESGFIVYPNPSNGTISVQADQNLLDELIVYNVLGEVVKPIVAHDGNQPNTLTVDFTHLEKGIYFLRSGQLVTKVVIE